MNNIFLFLYLTLSAFHIFFCYTDNRKMRMITKPLLMPLLLFYVLFATKTPSLPIILAIFFGFLGDTFLLSDNNKLFFLAGLLSFLIGHISYVFALHEKINILPSENTMALILSILLILLAIGYFSLYKYLKEMKLPVLAYSLVIITMFFYSILYKITSNTVQSFMSLIGSLLFMLSDYLLARSIFINSFKFKNCIVMFTYLSAQLLLVIGLI